MIERLRSCRPHAFSRASRDDASDLRQTFLVRHISFSKDALRTLSRMPANTSTRIRAKIQQYAADPASQANNLKALKGWSGVLRLRVGDWRELLTETGEIIAMIEVAPRGGAYD